MMNPPPPPSRSHYSYTSFPILAISILGILTTAVILLSYYVFVIKCCLHWPRRPDLLLLRLASSPRRLRRGRSLAPSPPSPSPASGPPRGLDISTINSIPTSRFSSKTSTAECSVCISDFRDQELLRVLPVCAHAFHIDCIDTWLQFNPNCPLCRADISLVPVHRFSGRSPDHLRETSPADFAAGVSIGVRDEGSSAPGPAAKEKHCCKQVKSMGDECIDMRGERDERFAVHPIRRSFSMDSSNDRQLYLSVQEALRQARSGEGSSAGGGGGGSGRIRRSLFSFGRSSRCTASVLPL